MRNAYEALTLLKIYTWCINLKKASSRIFDTFTVNSIKQTGKSDEPLKIVI